MQEKVLLNFGDTVRRIRKSKGISQEVLADMCELHRTYLSDVELGKRNISLENIDKIACALGMTVSEYRNKDASFWALIKFVSEGLGYTDRRRGTVKSFSPNEVVSFCSTQGISINEQTAYLAAQYSIKRASLLNDIAQHMLMDAATAEAEFQKLFLYHK